MANLHLAKERGSESKHEYDLRGLGNDPLLQAYPFTVLLIESENHGKFMRAARASGFQTELVKGSLLSVFPRRKGQGEHKTQAIQLFTFLLKHLDAFSAKDRIYLFEHNHLRFTLENAIKNQHRELADEFSKQFSEVKWAEGKSIHFQYATTLHLSQAGFAVKSAQELQDASFTLPQLQTWKEELRREHQMISRERKVG